MAKHLIMAIALIVPVLRRFDLFTYMINSIDCEIKPYVINNYVHNRGVSAAWNEGLRLALTDGYEHAIITNDDVKFESKCLTLIEKTLKETDATLVSANQNNKYDPREKLVEYADFFCFGVNINKLINSAGSFDENFYPAYFEDNDMYYRLKLANQKCYINTRAIAYHTVSGTQYGTTPQNTESWACPPKKFEELRQYYISKWGGEPRQEKFVTPFNDANKNIWEW